MKKSLIVGVLTLGMAFMSAPLFAVDVDDTDDTEMAQKQDRPYKAARQKMKRMSPQEKKSFMQEIEAKWDKLSDDEKEAFKEKHKEKAERFKEKLDKKCKEMQEDDGEKIYIKIYGMEQLQNGNARNGKARNGKAR